MGGGWGEGDKICEINWFPLSPPLSHQGRGREKSGSGRIFGILCCLNFEQPVQKLKIN
jgi:hypothetical protein